MSGRKAFERTVRDARRAVRARWSGRLSLGLKCSQAGGRPIKRALAARQASGMGGSVPPRQPPGGLPRGRPRAELGKIGRRWRRGLPTAVRAVGLRQVDGMALRGRVLLGERQTERQRPRGSGDGVGHQWTRGAWSRGSGRRQTIVGSAWGSSARPRVDAPREPVGGGRTAPSARTSDVVRCAIGVQLAGVTAGHVGHAAAPSSAGQGRGTGPRCRLPNWCSWDHFAYCHSHPAVVAGGRKISTPSCSGISTITRNS